MSFGAAAHDLESVEQCYLHSIDMARQQDALSWELRATTSLTRLVRDRGDSARARAMLAAVYDRFTEGFDTADMVAAKALLAEMSCILHDQDSARSHPRDVTRIHGDLLA